MCNYKYKRKLIFFNNFIKLAFILCMTAILQSYAQSIVITGTVVDAESELLPGVNVIVVGTALGTITDGNGSFTISVPNENAILEFSFIGYASQEIVVGNQRTINVTLGEDASEIEELVVMGYGVQRKSDITGSVATVDPDRLRERPVANFGEALIGQMAGVHIQQTHGMPGGEGLTVRVRGTPSISQSNEPLYVIDGFPMESGAFRLVSPSDIESIQVLKDASSTAIYGSRGSNGVVIITTRQGQAGRPRVTFTAQLGFQQRERDVEMMNRDQFIEWFIDGRNNAWLDQPVLSSDPDQSPHTIHDPNSRRQRHNNALNLFMIPDGTGSWIYDFQDPVSVAKMPDNNWQDLLFRNAMMQQYEISITGGNENTRYAFSGSYLNQEGIVRSTDHQRYNFRTNIFSKINRYLEIGVNLGAFHGQGREMDDGKDAPVMYALNLPPIYPVRNPDGTWGSMVRNHDILAGDVASPLAIADDLYRHRKRYGWLGSAFVQVNLLDGLNYKITVNGSLQDNHRVRYKPSYLDEDSSRAPRQPESEDNRQTQTIWLVEQTLNYNKVFAQKHAVSFVGLYSAEKRHRYDVDGQTRQHPTDNVLTMNQGIMHSLTSSHGQDNAMISLMASANYVYDNKYMLKATIRRDGSSRFGKNNRWGNFPSASIGWRIGQEEFMQGLGFLSDMKLRASYGIVGNNRIGDFASVGLLGTGYYPTGDTQMNISVHPNTMPNDYLGWERTRQINLGIDMALFRNRIRIEADFYDGTSEDLLFSVPMPRITGYASQMQNTGKVQNRGMEFLVSSRNLVREFKWSTDFNISFNRNKVLELGPDGQPHRSGAANANNSFITTIGHPVASFYGYVQEGVFMNQADLDRYLSRSIDRVGDPRFKDVDGDGVITEADKDIIGNNHPNFVAGMNNTFSYKNFTLNVQLTASQGAELFSFFMRMCGIYHGDRNGMIMQQDRWRSEDEPGNGMLFRPTRNPRGWMREPSTAWVSDGSYLRIRNVSLSYNFDRRIAEMLYVQGLRLFVTGQNLYTWTNYLGYDPESSSEVSNNQNSRGGDYIGYPAARSVIFGISVNF